MMKPQRTSHLSLAALAVAAMLVGLGSAAAQNNVVRDNRASGEVVRENDATAVQRQAQPPGRGAAGARSTVVAPLTATECRNLGGLVETVHLVSACTGKPVCTTIDRNGVVRAMCINEAG